MRVVRASDGESALRSGLGAAVTHHSFHVGASIKRDIGHLCHDRPPSQTKAPSGSQTSARKASVDSTSSTKAGDSPDKTDTEPLANAGSIQGATSAVGSSGPSAALSTLTGEATALTNPSTPGPSIVPTSSDILHQQQAAISATPAMFGSLSLGALGFSPGMLANQSGTGSVGPGGNIPAVAGIFGPNQGQSAWNASTFRSGLGGASWLGLGGGPASLDGDGGVTQGDSAGGNEFNILSEFLESLDGGAFTMTPGGNMSNAAGGALSGFPNSGANSNVASPVFTPKFAGGGPSAKEEEELVNLDDASAQGAGADAAADVLGNYSTLNDGPSSSLPGAAPPSAGKSQQKTQHNRQGSTSGLSRPATPGQRNAAAFAANAGGQATGAGGAGNSEPTANAPTPTASGVGTGVAGSGPSLNWANKTERFFMTAADQKDGTRDERLGRVIQAKYEAGLLRPYNHVNGYARLNRWMERK